MGTTKPVSATIAELREAYDFASSGSRGEHVAYLCRDTGKTHLKSDYLDLEDEELPDDLEDEDRYISLPHKTELDLGKNLVLAFTHQELPGDYHRVADFFQSKGGYRRFRDLLEARDMLQKWYDFEEQATDNALRDWCALNDIRLIEE